MKFAILFATLATLVSVNAQSNQITLNTPQNVVECQPTLLQWTGGTGPYFLSVRQPDANGPVVQDLGTQNGNSFRWTVPFPGGTTLGLLIKDSNGIIGQTAPFPVASSSDSSCLGQTGVPSGGSAPPASSGGSAPPASSPPAASSPPPPITPPPPVSSPPAVSSPSPTAPASSKPSSPASSAPSAPSSSKPAGAMPTAQVGVAGVVGLLVAAVLA